MIKFPNGKCYIGQTICSVIKRIKEHCYPSSSCVAVRRAIQKYGVVNIRVELIKTFIGTQQDADDIERELIAEYNTMAPNGYNLTPGGVNDTLQTEEIKRKRALAITGRVLSEKSRKQIATSLTGKRHPHRSYPVLRITENGDTVRFETVRDAIENTPGSSQSGISKCVRGELHKHCQQADGSYYRWQHV